MRTSANAALGFMLVTAPLTVCCRAPGGAAAAGSFQTGQPADIVLAAPGFDQSGGPQLLNHPTGLASDGRSLLVADRWNNRVLVWKAAPASNRPPDLVLGQPDFSRNNPGSGRGQLNWPGNVSMSRDGKIAVADTHNDRILVWNRLPERNGAPADLELGHSRVPAQSRERLEWPWGVWTDGIRLAAVATHGAAVLIWSRFPTRDDEPPDLVLQPPGAGTPRNVTSDGRKFFALSDHNYRPTGRPATLVWREFPTRSDQAPALVWNEWVKGGFTPDGKLILAGSRSAFIFNGPPETAETDADVVLQPRSYRNGDGPDAVVASGRLYVCNYNGNNILAWNDVPSRERQPDFSLGSDRPDQDTWAEQHFITNPVLATDGKSLLASSDFDRKLFVWRSLPMASGARPDLVIPLREAPWDNALHGSRFALAGKSTVSLWEALPLRGEPPSRTWNRFLGRTPLLELTGVAMDSRYFYVADRQAGAVSVWRGVPNSDSEPAAVIRHPGPGHLNSDGRHLLVAPFEGHEILAYAVDEIERNPVPVRIGGRGALNLPGQALSAGGRLFVADRSNHRVLVWERLADGLARRPPDAYLGAGSPEDRDPAIGRESLFMPGSLAWDGRSLWVGEFKFSTRILRYSPAGR